MAAERTFWHKGLRVDVWAKSFKWSGLPFTVFLGSPPDDDKIRKMIDTAQKAGNRFREVYDDAHMETGYRCPICSTGTTFAVAPEVWQCNRPTCNSEFFIDGDPDHRMLNCRDKPRGLTLRQRFSGWWNECIWG